MGGIGVEEISSPVARSKFCCDDSGISNKRHYHSSPPHLHHLLHRHNRRQPRRRYHRRTDIDDENDSNDEGDDKKDGDNDDDDEDDEEEDDNDEETCLECFHSRLHQRFYDRRSSRSSNDVDARLDVEHVEVRRPETTSSLPPSLGTTTTVHPLVRTSPSVTTAASSATTARSTATASTTIANPSVVTAMARGCKIPPYLATILILSYTLLGIAGW